MQIVKKHVEDLVGEDFDLDTVIEYARREDSYAFFELLKDNAGVGRDLDDILYGYAEENKADLMDWIENR